MRDILTARARFGWTVDRFLPYAFAGAAVGNAEVSRFASVTGTKTVTPPPTVDAFGNVIPGTPVTNPLSLPRNPQSESRGVIAYGYTAGLGIDIGITANMFLRAEWEYVQFFAINDVRVNVNSAHAGIGLKF
jgi:opacity protein-like surface antigen